MSERDNDMLPEKMRSDLHDLVPSAPPGRSERNAELLADAHRQMGHGSGWMHAARRVVVAAAVLVAVGIAWQVQRPTDHARFAAATSPTIVDALRLAKRPAASQVQIDRMIMAAVQLKPEAVQ